MTSGETTPAGRCRTCRGEGEIETSSTSAMRCIDCAGTGRAGGEPPNRPLQPETPPAPDVGEKPKYRIWAAHCPFRKSGTPVLGTMGSTIRGVVVFEMETWTRLCQDVPQLQTTLFEVGTFDGE